MNPNQLLMLIMQRMQNQPQPTTMPESKGLMGIDPSQYQIAFDSSKRPPVYYPPSTSGTRG